MTSGVVLAPLTVALALGVSGVAKLRSDEPLATAFEAMGVPAALRGRAVVQALPWLEIGLAVALLVLPYPLSVVVTSLVLLLMLAYLGLVVAALGQDTEVDCHCFGGLGAGRVTGVTVVRNGLLVAAAAWSLYDALRGHSFVQRLGGTGVTGLSWLVGAALLAGVAVTVVWRPADEREPAPFVDDGTVRGIPFIELQEPGGGTTSLPALAARRPVLLVMLSTTCGMCGPITAVIGGWGSSMPGVEVRVVCLPGVDPQPEWPGEVLLDGRGVLTEVLGMRSPSAVLLGADALIAAGPALGPDEVFELVEAIQEDLASR